MCVFNLTQSAKDKYLDDWTLSVLQIIGKIGQGRNKLRLYENTKLDYEHEQYVDKVMCYQQRSAFAEFKSGIAPIRLEMGRYEKLNVNNRMSSLQKW